MIESACRRCLTLCCVVAFVMLCLSGRAALGQWVGSVYDPGIPLLTDAEIEELPGRLGLSQSQRTHFDAILAGGAQRLDALHGKLDALRKANRDAIERLPEQGDALPWDEKAWAKRMEAQEKWKAAERGLALQSREICEYVEQINGANDAVLDEIGRMLEKHQFQVWERFLMDRRRERTLRRETRFSGERVDVVGLVDELELDATVLDLVAPAITTYVHEVDAMLVQRNQTLIESGRAMYAERTAITLGEMPSPTAEFDEALRNLPPDAPSDAVWKLAQRQQERVWQKEIELLKKREPEMAVHRRIAETNRAAVENIGAMLPEDRRDELMSAYLAKAYWDIYAPTKLDKWLDRVLALEDLSAAQLDGLNGVIDGYYQPYRAQSDQVLQAIKDRQEDGWKDRRMQGMDAAAKERMDALAEQWNTEMAKKKALDKGVVEAVWPMLTEAQRAVVGEAALGE